MKLLIGKVAKRIDVQAWLQLVRLPNLLSVPGDPWAGLVLASAANSTSLHALDFLWTALVSVCLYAAGLVLNDLHDESFDQAHRPERPLPSQRISRPAAAKLCTSLFALGAVCSLPLGRPAFVTTLMLVALVAAYNLQFKQHRTNASICMGLCRGCSALVGAAAAGFGFAALVAAAGITVYIAAVTWIAAGENRTQTLDRIVLVPAYAFASAGGLVAARMGGPTFFPSWVLGLVLLGWATRRACLHGSRLRNKPVPPAQMQPAIGGYIRILIPWQAGLLAIGGAPLLGLLLFAAAPFAGQLARRYAES